MAAAYLHPKKSERSIIGPLPRSRSGDGCASTEFAWRAGCAQCSMRSAKDGRVYYYLSGFRPSRSGYGPGSLLIQEAMRYAIEQGDQRVRFSPRG